MNDLTTMLKQQMENNIAGRLDAAVATGDAATARRVAKEYADLQVAAVPRAPVKTPPTKEQIMSAITAKATWFGTDPKKSALAAELGKSMLPERFETADAFADALLKAVEEHGKPVVREPDDEDAEEDAESDEDDGEKEAAPLRTRKNGTAAPELGAGSRSNSGSSLRQAFETGDIKHLPKAAADEIKRSADKFTRNNTKEQRAAFIKSAVTTRARADLIASGKFDAKTGKSK